MDMKPGAKLPELGMYHFKARTYSPTLGRFLQTDPIGYGDGINWYNYGGADPVNNTDPSGLTTGSNYDFGPRPLPLVRRVQHDRRGNRGHG